MADRVVEEIGGGVPDMGDIVNKILQYVILEGKSKMEADGGFNPFVALAVKDNLFIEEMKGEQPKQVYAEASHTVCNVKGADAYALCYDGYVETDEGNLDAILAEGGAPGADTAYALAITYTKDEEGAFTFADQIVYIGKAPNFMIGIDPDDKFVPAPEEGEEEELIG